MKSVRQYGHDFGADNIACAKSCITNIIQVCDSFNKVTTKKYNERKVEKNCTLNYVCDSQDFVVANGKDLKCG